MSLPPPSRRTRTIDKSLRFACASALVLPVVVVVTLLLRLVVLVLADIDAAAAGVWPVVVDSVVLATSTAMLAIPTGVGAAVYLEEYGSSGRVGALIEFNIAQLAGVPSVIYGLLGLELFVRTLELGHGVLVGAGTLALLILPMITDGARAALREVPVSQREAGRALGGTRWQVVRHVVLPGALPGMVSSALLAITRALGEAAPLLVLGALALGGRDPGGALGLPVRIYAWLLDDAPAHAAAGALVLLAISLALSTIAAVIRARGRVTEAGMPWGKLR